MDDNKTCPLADMNRCGLQSDDCEFKHECQAMLEDENRFLLARLRDADELVRYYESAEGEWARETSARRKAYAHRGELLVECSKRGLLEQYYREPSASNPVGTGD